MNIEHRCVEALNFNDSLAARILTWAFTR